ncbi:MAG: hypothetical protein PF572_03690 [Patescibacteria group bacterium]|jgi:competence protein ComGC|nr:hypothetical protein [Patescibacteria group bacterium]
MTKTFLKNNKGFGLMEVLVSVLIISSLTVTVFSLIIQSIKLTANNKQTLSANTLVNQRLEYIRSLPYDDVGTISGIVTGIIPDSEISSSNNGRYTLSTYVNYVDDPFDGVDLGSPNDIIPNDYKIVRVIATWSGSFGEQGVTGYTNIAPRGIETALEGGTLSISVHDASGQPIENALVDIINNNVVPVININDDLTNSNGTLNYYGAPESIENYEVSVTKPGYSIDATYPRTATNTNPTKPHSTVLEYLRTDISFAIDLLSNLNIDVITANLPNNFAVSSDISGDDQKNSRLTIDSAGNIYIVWEDYRQTGDSKIYAQKYNSSGTPQWSGAEDGDVIIGTANGLELPDIDIDSAGNLYLAWTDGSIGNNDCYVVKLFSATGGIDWEGRVNVAYDNDNQTSPRIKVSENNGDTFATVVFEDDRDNELDVYFVRYDSSGNLIWGNDGEVRVNTNPVIDNTNQFYPHLDISSNEEIFIVWTDERNGSLDVYAQKYASSGIAVWLQDLMIPTEATSSAQFSASTAIDMDSFDNIYIIWTDERNGDQDIYAQKYDIDGNSLWGNDKRMNSDTGSADQFQPAIAIDSLNNIYIAWTDERNGNQDIYGQKYDSNGTPIWLVDMRINMDTNSNNQYNPDIVMNPSNNQPYITWESDDDGDINIYASSFGDYSTETPLNGVDILVRGAKKIGENPIIYKYEEIHTSDALGNISLTGIEWDSYSFGVDATSTGYELMMTMPSMPLNIDPGTTETIKLYLK